MDSEVLLSIIRYETKLGCRNIQGVIIQTIYSLLMEPFVYRKPHINRPLKDQTSAPDSIVAGVTKGVVVGTRGGWAYNETTGEIWPNTSVVGENNW